MAVFVAAFALAVCNFGGTRLASADNLGVITALPEFRDSSCRGGRAELFDECGDQVALFRRALALAEAQGKVLLVSYGAEWCIWCHVFDNYVEGEVGTFRYNLEGERFQMTERAIESQRRAAEDLNRMVSEQFVIVHIEAQYAPNGFDVLELAGAASSYNDEIPFIFSVDRTGRYAARFESSRVEIRRDTPGDEYRGYDRRALIVELSRLGAAASR